MPWMSTRWSGTNIELKKERRFLNFPSGPESSAPLGNFSSKGDGKSENAKVITEEIL